MSDTVEISVSGLTLFTHHGVTDEEQAEGQRLVVDLRFTPVGAVGALKSDDVAETVDYGAVSERVADFATANRYRTLEALISDIADVLIAEFQIARVWIKATKPEPPIDLEFSSSGGVAVELERTA